MRPIASTYTKSYVEIKQEQLQTLGLYHIPSNILDLSTSCRKRVFSFDNVLLNAFTYIIGTRYVF